MLIAKLRKTTVNKTTENSELVKFHRSKKISQTKLFVASTSNKQND